MAKLDQMIAECRAERRLHHDARRYIDAAASAIRERALLDARAAIVSKVENGYTFRPVFSPV